MALDPRNIEMALVGIPGTGDSRRYRELWANNPQFHTAIHTLARMLPMWVEGIALHAEADRERMDEAIALLMQAPTPPNGWELT